MGKNTDITNPTTTLGTQASMGQLRVPGLDMPTENDRILKMLSTMKAENEFDSQNILRAFMKIYPDRSSRVEKFAAKYGWDAALDTAIDVYKRRQRGLERRAEQELRTPTAAQPGPGMGELREIESAAAREEVPRHSPELPVDAATGAPTPSGVTEQVAQPAQGPVFEQIPASEAADEIFNVELYVAKNSGLEEQAMADMKDEFTAFLQGYMDLPINDRLDMWRERRQFLKDEGIPEGRLQEIDHYFTTGVTAPYQGGIQVELPTGEEEFGDQRAKRMAERITDDPRVQGATIFAERAFKNVLQPAWQTTEAFKHAFQNNLRKIQRQSRKFDRELVDPGQFATLVDATFGATDLKMPDRSDGILFLNKGVPVISPKGKNLKLGSRAENIKALADLKINGEIPLPSDIIDSLGEEKGKALIKKLMNLDPSFFSREATWMSRGNLDRVFNQTKMMAHHPIITYPMMAYEEAVLAMGEVMLEEFTDPKEWVLDYVLGKFVFVPATRFIKRKGLWKTGIMHPIKTGKEGIRAAQIRKELGTVIDRLKVLENPEFWGTSGAPAAKPSQMLDALSKMSEDELDMVARELMDGKQVSMYIPEEVLGKVDTSQLEKLGLSMVEPDPDAITVEQAVNALEDYAARQTFAEPPGKILANSMKDIDDRALEEILNMEFRPDQIAAGKEMPRSSLMDLLRKGETIDSIDDIAKAAMNDELVMQASIKKGQKVGLPKWGLEGTVLEASDDMLSVRLDNGMTMEVPRSHVIPAEGKITIRSAETEETIPSPPERGDYVKVKGDPNDQIHQVVESHIPESGDPRITVVDDAGNRMNIAEEAADKLSVGEGVEVDRVRQRLARQVQNTIRREGQAGAVGPKSWGPAAASTREETIKRMRKPYDKLKAAALEVNGDTKAAESLNAYNEMNAPWNKSKGWFDEKYRRGRKLILARRYQEMLDAFTPEGGYPDGVRTQGRRYVDNLRTKHDTIGGHVKATAEMDVHNAIWGPLSGDELDELDNLIALKDIAGRAKLGQPMPVENPQEMFDLLWNSAGKHPDSQRKIHEAFDRYVIYMRHFGMENMVKTGRLAQENMFEVYMPHRIIDKIFMGNQRLLGYWSLPRKAQPKFRGYLKKAIGSKRDIIAHHDVIKQYIATVLGDNALDDFYLKELPDMDAAVKAAAVKEMGPDWVKAATKNAKQGAPLDFGGKKYRWVQYEQGRYFREIDEANPDLVARAIYDALMTPESEVNRILSLPNDQLQTALEDYLIGVGDRGGNALRKALAMGRYKPLYLVPDEMATQVFNAKTYSSYIPLLSDIIDATRYWKAFTITAAGLPYHAVNLFGDTANMIYTAPGAVLHWPQAWRILSAVRHIPELPMDATGRPDISMLDEFPVFGGKRLPGFLKIRLTDQEKRALQISLDQAVLESGFLKEYTTSAMSGTDVSGVWNVTKDAYKRWSGYREALDRVAMVSYQLSRYEKMGMGLPDEEALKVLWAPQMENAIRGLTPIQAIGYIGRNAMIDYVDVPEWYSTWFRGFALPFITFPQKNFLNIAALTKALPTHPKEAAALAATVGVPLVAIQTWNQLGPYREAYDRIPMSLKQRPLCTVLHVWNDDPNNPEKATRAAVWAPRDPLSEAGQWLGWEEFLGYTQAASKGIITWEDAAKYWITETAVAPLKEIATLITPVAQAMMGLSANEDYYDHKKIYPDDEKELPLWAHKREISWYLVQKMMTITGQFARTEKSRTEELTTTTWGQDNTKLPIWVRRLSTMGAKGIFDWKRAFGYYEVDLDSSTVNDLWDQSQEVKAWQAHMEKKIIDDFITGDDLRPEIFVMKARNDIMGSMSDKTYKPGSTAITIMDAQRKHGIDFMSHGYLQAKDKGKDGTLLARLWSPAVMEQKLAWIIYRGVDPATGKALTEARRLELKKAQADLAYIKFGKYGVSKEYRPTSAETIRRVLKVLGLGEE